MQNVMFQKSATFCMEHYFAWQKISMQPLLTLRCRVLCGIEEDKVDTYIDP